MKTNVVVIALILIASLEAARALVLSVLMQRKQFLAVALRNGIGPFEARQYRTK